MTKINVNINKDIPPKRVIHKHKDFDNFLSTYHKLHTQKGIRDMWYRDKKKLAYIAIIIALLLILIFAEDGNAATKSLLFDDFNYDKLGGQELLIPIGLSV